MDVFKSHAAYRFQGFVLDVPNRRLSNAAGQEIKLNSRAFDTLVELLHHRGETLSKDHLMDTVWHGLVVEENNINQAICVVRKALGDSTGEPTFIKTVSGKGFCFVADVQPLDELVSEAAAATSSLQATASMGSATAEAMTTGATMPVGAVQGRWPAWWMTASALAFAVALLLIFVDVRPSDDAAVPDQPATAVNAYLETADVIANSIAVMPFTNLNAHGDGDLFMLGLHDELINQLTQVQNLKVISRDSVIHAVASGGSQFDMADALKAESLLTGSILAAGERARINLQMLNADTGIAVWSKSFEVDTQDMSDMISTQSDIALKVVKALELEARLPQQESLAALPTQSFKAHRYYLTARNSYNHQAEKEKWVLLGKALELDPDYADAHLMFANINTALAVTPLEGFSHEEHLQLASTSVDAYIRLEPDSSQGYALKSLVLGARGDWKGATEHLEILHKLGASEVEMKYGAVIEMSLGHFPEAVRIYEETLLTEPSNLYVRGLLMAAHEMAGNQHGARQEYALGNELKSVWWGRTVNVLLALGRKEPIDPGNTLDDFSPELRAVLRRLDDRQAVIHAVKDYVKNDNRNAKEDMFYSALAAWLGDTDMAVALLRGATDKVATSLFWGWLPVFAEVRHTEEFRQLLADAGLVDYWQEHGWPALCQPKGNTFHCN